MVKGNFTFVVLAGGGPLYFWHGPVVGKFVLISAALDHDVCMKISKYIVGGCGRLVPENPNTDGQLASLPESTRNSAVQGSSAQAWYKAFNLGPSCDKS